MTDQPDHHCPGCGTPRKAVPRYPWHFCEDCCSGAHDGHERGLDFVNATLGGGFRWRYKDEEDWHNATRALCFIKNRPVLVHEARFGGIAVEPIPDMPLPDRPGTADLRGHA